MNLNASSFNEVDSIILKIKNNFTKFVHTIYIKTFRRYKMEANQKINCTVSSCRYNNQEKAKCTLEAIHVEPIENINTEMPDESMCASYKFDEE